MKITETIDIRFPKTLAEPCACRPTKKRAQAAGRRHRPHGQWAACVPTPARATSVWNLPELCAIEVFPDRIEIGAGVNATRSWATPCRSTATCRR
jgi:hypothetical protein